MRLDIRTLAKNPRDAFAILDCAEGEAKYIAENALPDHLHDRAAYRAYARRRIKRIEQLRKELGA
jgi:hypothetical protein